MCFVHRPAPQNVPRAKGYQSRRSRKGAERAENVDAMKQILPQTFLPVPALPDRDEWRPATLTFTEIGFPPIPFDLAFFQHAHGFGPHVQRPCPDLVPERWSLVRLFPICRPVAPVNDPFSCPNNSDSINWHGAIQSHERSIRSGALFMNRARNRIPFRAGLAQIRPGLRSLPRAPLAPSRAASPHPSRQSHACPGADGHSFHSRAVAT